MPRPGPDERGDEPAAPAVAGRTYSGVAGSLRVTHYALAYRWLGGLQALLRYHLAHGAAWGEDSRVVTFFDAPGPRPTSPEGVAARIVDLRLTGWHSVAEARRRLRTVCAGPVTAAVYHDLWALGFAADLDGAARRLGMIHAPTPRVLSALTHHQAWLDGLLCVGEPAVAAARRLAPGLGPERVCWVPVPVTPPEAVPPRPPLPGRPLVLGYAGRLEREFKRVDRLPRLWRALQKQSIPVRLEILGEGPARGWLGRRLRGAEAVFHGRLEGPAYRAVLASWDVIVYTSDVEGMGLALLEAMSAGVLPVYPAIGGGAEGYVRAVHPDLLYPSGDFAHVAHVLDTLRRAAPAWVETLRARCRAVVAPHLGDLYGPAFAGFVCRLLGLPRRSPAVPRRRPRALADRLPIGILRRCAPGVLWGGRSALTG